MSAEFITLKWGTLKAWNLAGNDDAIAAMKHWMAEGCAPGAMQQRDTPDQKQAICDVIDAINGPINNDWTGEVMTKEAAKKYVMEYDQ